MTDNSPCFPLQRPTASSPPFFHPAQGQTLFHPGSGSILRNKSFKTPPRNRVAGTIEAMRNAQQQLAQREMQEGRGQKRKPADDSSDDSDSSDTPMKHRRSKSPEACPEPSSRRRPRREGSPIEAEPTPKRNRTGLEKQFNISKLLGTLDKPALLTVIHNFLDANPKMQAEIASFIPRPTLHTVRSHLQILEKNLAAAFPYTKSGPNKSDYSFNRVRGAITELIEAVLGYASHFTQPEEFPTTTFSYLQLAAATISRLPVWDNPTHNDPKRDAFEHLAEYYLTAIENAANKMSEGKVYGQALVEEWARDLAQANASAGQDLFQQAMREFGKRLGLTVGTTSSQLASQPTPMRLFGYSGGLFGGGQTVAQVGGW